LISVIGQGAEFGFEAAMKRLFLSGLVALVCFNQPVWAQALATHAVVSEDLSEQRRAVFVRIERRLDEPELVRIAAAMRAREKRAYARTQVNFFLPGMALNQGGWASVVFSPEPKVLISGLRREDEDMFVAEHQLDRRPLLGSWLTSPPAATGRLTIYSDHGRVFSEWRLRSGIKTVEELREGAMGRGRQFEVADGGRFVLTKSGDLEIWDKSTFIAVGERLRAEPTPVVVGQTPRKTPMAAPEAGLTKRPAVPLAQAPAAQAAVLPSAGAGDGLAASPVQRAPRVAAAAAMPTTGPQPLANIPVTATESANVPASAEAAPVLVQRPPAKAKGKSVRAAKASQPTKAAQSTKSSGSTKAAQGNQQGRMQGASGRQLATGDQIVGKIGNQF
jgi:hypothetical protein